MYEYSLISPPVVCIFSGTDRVFVGAVKTAHATGEAMVRAPMPGLVLNVLDAGTTVARGQAVVVLEARKMENDLPSPIDGTVEEVRVSKGQAVNPGNVLVVINAE